MNNYVHIYYIYIYIIKLCAWSPIFVQRLQILGFKMPYLIKASALYDKQIVNLGYFYIDFQKLYIKGGIFHFCILLLYEIITVSLVCTYFC